MVRIRLRRVGLKRQASYRIVVADKRRARDGRIIESIGFYNPRTQPDTIEVKEDRALYWLSTGAQPSDSVRSLFNRTGTLERLTRLKAGEDIEKLAGEAVAAAEKAQAISPKTRFASPVGTPSKIQAAEAVVDAAGEVEAE